MKIGVDAGCLGVNDKRLKVGVYTITYNLFKALKKIDSKNLYLLYSFIPIEKKVLHEFGLNVQNIVVKPSIGWAKIWLPLRILKDKPDVFLALGQSTSVQLPIGKKYKTIGLVYDLAFEKFKDCYPNSYKSLSHNTKKLIKNSDKIICISQTTAQDIKKIYKIRSSAITIAYPGVSETFKSKGQKYSSKSPFFLSVGAIKRIKNVPTIIKAFEQFLSETKKEYQLYIVGGDKWFDPNVFATMQALPKAITKKIRFLGHVSNDELAALYKGAKALVAPSMYEGFGLPILEAMKSGCPVIGSKSGSIPEVLDDTGILVDPLDHEQLTEAMIKISSDKNLLNTLRKKGLQRAKTFRWDLFAQTVYNQLTL